MENINFIPFKNKYNGSLIKLRRLGRVRLENLVNSNKETPSVALRLAIPHIKPQYSSVIDCGCGECPDIFILHNHNFEKTYGMDIAPLFTEKEITPNHKVLVRDYYEQYNSTFIQQDVCEKWNFDFKFDLVLSNAMITLIKLEDRQKFYSNVFNNLKSNGIFSISFPNLVNGYYLKNTLDGFDVEHSIKLLQSIGFKIMDRGCNYTIAKKEEN